MATSVVVNPFNDLPDELIQKIFLLITHFPTFMPNNHVRISPNSLYFDYSIQQPLLKETHQELFLISLVCRRFYHIINSSYFWENKCRDDHVLLPDQTFPTDFTAYEKLYVDNPFHPSFNLIKENKWKKSDNTDSEIELIPIGSYRLYDEFDRLSPCRVTSYTLGQFIQRDVQLHSSTHLQTNLASLRPIIEFSVCVVPRWDCCSECHICLIFSNGHRWDCSRTFPKWRNSKWHRLSYRYAEYEQFPSSVTVYLSGKDIHGFAGYYGIKFAQTRLRLVCLKDENETNEEYEMILEPDAEKELIQYPASEPQDDNLSVDENMDELFPSSVSLLCGLDSAPDSD